VPECGFINAGHAGAIRRRAGEPNRPRKRGTAGSDRHRPGEDVVRL